MEVVSIVVWEYWINQVHMLYSVLTCTECEWDGVEGWGGREGAGIEIKSRKNRFHKTINQKNTKKIYYKKKKFEKKKAKILVVEISRYLFSYLNSLFFFAWFFKLKTRE